MKNIETMIVAMSKVEIPICPYCGAEPIVEVETKKSHTESDKVILQKVSCSCCGLAAPINVWCAIADNFEKPIVE